MSMDRRPVEFRGRALDTLRDFPENAKQDAGFQIDLLQQGLDPGDWRPMQTVGKGAREIRIREDDSNYRVIYVANIGDKVYVLHCFEKKTQRTPKQHIDAARSRYRELMRELENG